jgi:hypothetical protein
MDKILYAAPAAMVVPGVSGTVMINLPPHPAPAPQPAPAAARKVVTPST